MSLLLAAGFSVVVLWLIHGTARAFRETRRLRRSSWCGLGHVVAIRTVAASTRGSFHYAPVVEVDTGDGGPWRFTAGSSLFRGALPAEGRVVRVLCDPGRRVGRLDTLGEVWGSVAAWALFTCIASAMLGLVVWTVEW